MLHLSTLKYDFNLLGFFLNTGSAFIFYVLALLATRLGGRHQMSASRRTGEVEVDVLTSAARGKCFSSGRAAPAEELTAELNGSSK